MSLRFSSKRRGTIRTNDDLYSKKHDLKVLFKEMQFVAFFIFHVGKTRMQVKNDLRCLRQKSKKSVKANRVGSGLWILALFRCGTLVGVTVETSILFHYNAYQFIVTLQ